MLSEAMRGCRGKVRPDMTAPHDAPSPLASPLPEAELLRPVPHLRVKAAELMLLTLALMVGSVLYLLHARGVFEPTQRLVLTADDSEGVVVGMDMTFSGFPIGRVRRIELGGDGNARIVVDVARRDAHWLRSSSVFTLVRGIVGGTTIMDDPPLEDGAERPVLRGDATAEIPHLMANARQLMENLNVLTSADSPLGDAIAHLRSLSEQLNSPGGALAVLMGSAEDAKKIVVALDHTNRLLARLDGMAAKADKQVFGAGDDPGLMPQARETIHQLNALLAATRESLKKADAVLAEAQAIGANVRESTTDLGALRAEVESSLRKVDGLVNEVHRKWPFARDTELKLP